MHEGGRAGRGSCIGAKVFFVGLQNKASLNPELQRADKPQGNKNTSHSHPLAEQAQRCQRPPALRKVPRGIPGFRGDCVRGRGAGRGGFLGALITKWRQPKPPKLPEIEPKPPERPGSCEGSRCPSPFCKFVEEHFVQETSRGLRRQKGALKRRIWDLESLPASHWAPLS